MTSVEHTREQTGPVVRPRTAVRLMPMRQAALISIESINVVGCPIHHGFIRLIGAAPWSRLSRSVENERPDHARENKN